MRRAVDRELRWAFTNGESHTQLEDAILDKMIDKERAGIAAMRIEGESVEVKDQKGTASKSVLATRGYKRPRRGSLTKLEQDVAANGDAAVFNRIAAGETMGAIAKFYGVDRDTIYAWIKRGGEERAALWAEAKKRSADAHVEKGLAVLSSEEATQSSAHAALAKSRAEYHKWLATVRNRAEYGDYPAVAVQVNFDLSELHLNALRAHGHMRAAPAKALDAEVVDNNG